MRNGIDCHGFRERLDEYRAGTLSTASSAEMERHAGSCPVCAMTLRMQDHLEIADPDLAAGLPEEHVRSMWPRVREEIARRESRRARRHRSGARTSVWIPALAAAAVLLLAAGNLYLLREVGAIQERERQLVERERGLVEQVELQERRLAELEASVGGIDPRGRTAALAATTSWERMLGRIDRISVGELTALLAALPPGTTLLRAEDLARIDERRPAWPTRGWAGPAAALDLSDGLQADELLRWIQALPLDPERNIATNRILERIRSLSVQG